MAVQKQDDQHEHTFSSYVRIRDVVLKTCLGRWTIGKSGERGSGISVLPARYEDDDILILSTNPMFLFTNRLSLVNTLSCEYNSISSHIVVCLFITTTRVHYLKRNRYD